MINEPKNHYGVNTSYLCHEASLSLKEVSDVEGYVTSDFDVETDEGFASVGVIALLESACAVMEQQQEDLEQLRKERDELLRELCDIQGMCIGEITMGYKLDADSVGCGISKATGMTHPELLAKLNKTEE